MRTVLSQLFHQHFGYLPEHVEAFPHTASGRRYFRLSANGVSAIGTYGQDEEENKTFLYFSEHFKNKGLNVPEIYCSKGGGFYLQQDLGRESLMDRNKKADRGNGFPYEIKKLYQKTIRELIRIQIKGGEGLDYGRAYPVADFDKQAMLWDLNYFKYYFLNVAGIHFDENKLQHDFNALADYLQTADNQYFLFRDFQSRNVMLLDEEPYFIDYQGGRKGALQYDLVSLLFQSKAEIPHPVREELLEYYMDAASAYIPLCKKTFRTYFDGYALIRLLQVLGAYGRRGLIERIPYFIQSIPLALANLGWWSEHKTLPIEIPYLEKIVNELRASEKFKEKAFPNGKDAPLVVRIFSFSYKEGIPEDHSGNGGGFVFDCRHILNPGRYEPYKTQTGRDEPVRKFLLEKTEMPRFLENAYDLVDCAVENYLQRGFEHLQVSFGCTGGQHRSVFSADSLAKHLAGKYQINTQVKHVVQERKNWVNTPY